MLVSSDKDLETSEEAHLNVSSAPSSPKLPDVFTNSRAEVEPDPELLLVEPLILRWKRPNGSNNTNEMMCCRKDAGSSAVSEGGNDGLFENPSSYPSCDVHMEIEDVVEALGNTSELDYDMQLSDGCSPSQESRQDSPGSSGNISLCSRSNIDDFDFESTLSRIKNSSKSKENNSVEFQENQNSDNLVLSFDNLPKPNYVTQALEVKNVSIEEKSAGPTTSGNDESTSMVVSSYSQPFDSESVSTLSIVPISDFCGGQTHSEETLTSCSSVCEAGPSISELTCSSTASVSNSLSDKGSQCPSKSLPVNSIAPTLSLAFGNRDLTVGSSMSSNGNVNKINDLLIRMIPRTIGQKRKQPYPHGVVLKNIPVNSYAFNSPLNENRIATRKEVNKVSCPLIRINLKSNKLPCESSRVVFNALKTARLHDNPSPERCRTSCSKSPSSQEPDVLDQDNSTAAPDPCNSRSSSCLSRTQPTTSATTGNLATVSVYPTPHFNPTTRWVPIEEFDGSNSNRLLNPNAKPKCATEKESSRASAKTLDKKSSPPKTAPPPRNKTPSPTTRVGSPTSSAPVKSSVIEVIKSKSAKRKRKKQRDAAAKDVNRKPNELPESKPREKSCNSSSWHSEKHSGPPSGLHISPANAEKIRTLRTFSASVKEGQSQISEAPSKASSSTSSLRLDSRSKKNDRPSRSRYSRSRSPRKRHNSEHERYQKSKRSRRNTPSPTSYRYRRERARSSVSHMDRIYSKRSRSKSRSLYSNYDRYSTSTRTHSRSGGDGGRSSPFVPFFTPINPQESIQAPLTELPSFAANWCTPSSIEEVPEPEATGEPELAPGKRGSILGDASTSNVLYTTFKSSSANDEHIASSSFKDDLSIDRMDFETRDVLAEAKQIVSEIMSEKSRNALHNPKSAAARGGTDSVNGLRRKDKKKDTKRNDVVIAEIILSSDDELEIINLVKVKDGPSNKVQNRLIEVEHEALPQYVVNVDVANDDALPDPYADYVKPIGQEKQPRCFCDVCEADRAQLKYFERFLKSIEFDTNISEANKVRLRVELKIAPDRLLENEQLCLERQDVENALLNGDI